MIAVLSTLAVVAVLLTYAHLARTGRPRPFHLANVIGGAILAPINFAAGVPAQAALSAFFGVVGGVALYKEHTTT